MTRRLFVESSYFSTIFSFTVSYFPIFFPVSFLSLYFALFYSPPIILHLHTNSFCRYGTCDSKTPRISSTFLSTLTKPKFPHSLFFSLLEQVFFVYTYLINLFLLPFSFTLSSGNSCIYFLLHSLFRWSNPDHLHSS